MEEFDMNLHEVQQFLELYQVEQNESKTWLENKLQQIKTAGEYIPTTEQNRYSCLFQTGYAQIPHQGRLY